jgi:hypothetical protein
VNTLSSIFAACSLVASQALASPSIGSLAERDLDPPEFCQFFASKARMSVVLELKYWEAKMRLDDKLVRLKVEEAKCLRNCVVPGKSGVRVFRMSAPGVAATLTKKVSCARDAEVCGGLEEGGARLEVSTSAGRTAVPIWGEYCDM